MSNRTVIRIASAVMTVLFALSAWVQLNDPDPWRWFAVYAAAAVLSALHSADRAPTWHWPGTIAVCATAWLLGILLTTRDVGAPMGHGPGGVLAFEVVREALGLALVLGWMAAIAYDSWRNARPVRDDGTER